MNWRIGVGHRTLTFDAPDERLGFHEAVKFTRGSSANCPVENVQLDVSLFIRALFILFIS